MCGGCVHLQLVAKICLTLGRYKVLGPRIFISKIPTKVFFLSPRRMYDVDFFQSRLSYSCFLFSFSNREKTRFVMVSLVTICGGGFGDRVVCGGCVVCGCCEVLPNDPKL